MTVFLGVLVLRERLNVTQWVAVGISIVAVIVLAVGYGQLPWIALVLAFSFGFYGLIKKRVGPKVDAVSGLTLETAWLAPLAVGQLVFVAMTSGLTMGTVSPWHSALLLMAGVVTAIPLLLFAAASRRLPLIFMGDLRQFGAVDWLVAERLSNTLQLTDNLTKIYKSHTFKTGFMAQRIALPWTGPPWARGRFNYDGFFTSMPNRQDLSTGRAQFLLTPVASTVPGVHPP